MHLDLPHFDFKNGLYFLNVGEGSNRCWEDSKDYGFISAGQNPKYSNQIRILKQGDIIAAFISKHGYVGIGRITKEAVSINDFKIKEMQLRQLDLKIPNIFENCENENSEFAVNIDWITTVDKKDAKWKAKSEIYTIQLIKASLERQTKTIKYLEQEFEINFKELRQND